MKFEQTTGKISFLASTAITDDEPYSATNTDPYALIEAVNSALTHMGTYTKVDETLSSDTTSTEYTLPTGVSNLVRVEYSVDDSYSPQLSWREIEGKLYTYTPFSALVFIPIVALPEAHMDDIWMAFNDATARAGMRTGTVPREWAEREHADWAADPLR